MMKSPMLCLRLICAFIAGPWGTGKNIYLLADASSHMLLKLINSNTDDENKQFLMDT